MKAYTLDLRERVVQFVAGAARGPRPPGFFGWANAPSIATWPRPNEHPGTQDQLGPLAQARSGPTTGARLPPAGRHAPGLQRVFGVSHNAVWVRLQQLGFTLKKLTKYRERTKCSGGSPRDWNPGPAACIPRRVRRGSPAVSGIRTRPEANGL